MLDDLFALTVWSIFMFFLGILAGVAWGIVREKRG